MWLLSFHLLWQLGIFKVCCCSSHLQRYPVPLKLMTENLLNYFGLLRCACYCRKWKFCFKFSCFFQSVHCCSWFGRENIWTPFLKFCLGFVCCWFVLFCFISDIFVQSVIVALFVVVFVLVWFFDVSNNFLSRKESKMGVDAVILWYICKQHAFLTSLGKFVFNGTLEWGLLEHMS